MSKDVLFLEDGALDKVIVGMDRACKAVVGTLGPKGRNVYIDDAMNPQITNNGEIILQHMSFEDKLENMGLKSVQNTCGQTNDEAGDANTTTAALYHAIVHEALKRPENPMEVMESLEITVPKILKEIRKKSQKIKKEDIKKVALVASENKEVSSIISDIIEKLGEKATIKVEDSRTSETTYEIIDGYEANVGFLSNAFVNEKNRARCVMENAFVFVSEKKISSVSDITEIQKLCQIENIGPFVIVCEDIEDAILGVYVKSKEMGLFNSVVIRATGDLLKDIEAAVGAKRVSNSTGVTFQNIEKKHLGKVKKITVDAKKTMIIPDNVSLASAYANHLQKFANEEQNQFIKERWEKRIAQLRGKIAVIKVGGYTDYARNYLRGKTQNAVKSSLMALEGGVVEGGGMTFWRISQDIKPKTIGEEILKKALTVPLRKIIENAGKDYAEIVKNLPNGQGYNAKKNCYEDLLKTGIVDPTNTECFALQNTVSSAAKFITTFCTISDTPEKK